MRATQRTAHAHGDARLFVLKRIESRGPGPIRHFLTAFLLATAALVAGCSSTPGDPFEPVNRQVFQFNETADRYVLRPVAEGYQEVTPRPVNVGVSNFFSNLDDVTVLVNTLAQLRFHDAAATTYRLMINSTFGLLGVIDIATPSGQPKREADFGQTLGRWGVREGPFLMLPLLGPSNLRDAPARYVDGQIDPLDDHVQWETRLLLTGIQVVDQRASLLGASDLFNTAATDPYAFMRDAWSSRRARDVYRGDPPPGAIPGNDPDDDFDPFSDEGDEDLFDDGGDDDLMDDGDGEDSGE